MTLCTALAANAAPLVASCSAPDASWAECAGVQSVGGDDAAAPSPDFASQSLPADGATMTSIDAASTVAAIPEPHTNLLMLAGLAAIGFMAMRRRRP